MEDAALGALWEEAKVLSEPLPESATRLGRFYDYEAWFDPSHNGSILLEHEPLSNVVGGARLVVRLVSRETATNVAYALSKRRFKERREVLRATGDPPDGVTLASLSCVGCEDTVLDSSTDLLWYHGCGFCETCVVDYLTEFGAQEPVDASNPFIRKLAIWVGRYRRNAIYERWLSQWEALHADARAYATKIVGKIINDEPRTRALELAQAWEAGRNA